MFPLSSQVMNLTLFRVNRFVVNEAGKLGIHSYRLERLQRAWLIFQSDHHKLLTVSQGFE